MRSRMERALLLTPWSAQPYLQLGADRFEAGEVAEAHAFFAAAGGGARIHLHREIVRRGLSGQQRGRDSPLAAGA